METSVLCFSLFNNIFRLNSNLILWPCNSFQSNDQILKSEYHNSAQSVFSVYLLLIQYMLSKRMVGWSDMYEKYLLKKVNSLLSLRTSQIPQYANLHGDLLEGLCSTLHFTK